MGSIKCIGDIWNASQAFGVDTLQFESTEGLSYSKKEYTLVPIAHESLSQHWWTTNQSESEMVSATLLLWDETLLW